MEEKKEGRSECQGGSSECEKFLSLVNLMLDNEANQQEEEYISSHIEECSPCFKQLELEKQLRETLKSKIAHKEVPSELVDLIKTKIKSLA